MSDDPTNSPSSAPEGAEEAGVETQEAKDEGFLDTTNAQDDDGDAGDGDADETEGEADDDIEEVDVDGKKYALPKALKPALMMQADYTRKTQEVAEQRKGVEARAAEIEQFRQVQEALADDLAEVKALDKQIDQFTKVDWDALISQDPVQAQRLRLTLDNLKEARQKAAGEVQQKGQKLALDEQQFIAKQVEQANQVLARDIPGWSPAKDLELQNFAKNGVGFTDGELHAVARVLLKMEGAAFAKFAKMAHMASVGQRALETAKTAPKPSQAPLPKPIPTVRAKAPAAKDPDRMSEAEWMKWRQSQLRK